jgi:transcriptional regulator with XRE-family HTH domain
VFLDQSADAVAAFTVAFVAGDPARFELPDHKSPKAIAPSRGMEVRSYLFIHAFTLRTISLRSIGPSREDPHTVAITPPHLTVFSEWLQLWIAIPIPLWYTFVALTTTAIAAMINQRRPDSLDIAAGQRIKVERVARRMSQTALAEGIGVSFQQVQKYEKGLNRVGAGRLNRIAEVLGIPVAAFFEMNPSATLKGDDGKTSPLEMLAEPGAARVLRAFTQLPEGPLRRAVLDLLEKMAGYEQSGDASVSGWSTARAGDEKPANAILLHVADHGRPEKSSVVVSWHYLRDKFRGRGTGS